MQSSTTNLKEKLIEGLNEAQKKAVEQPAKSCTKIIAGAGTGKTKIISKRFSKLYFDLKNDGIKDALNRILVITFTDKAAEEMKGRIIKELQENDVNTSNANFWIFTFHSFCNTLLRLHAQEIGLTPEYELADEIQLSDIYKNIVRKIEYAEIDEIADIDEICKSLNLDKTLLLPASLASLAQIIDMETLFDEIYSLIKKIKSLGLTAKEFLEKTTIATKTFSQIVGTLPFKAESKDEFVANWKQHLKKYTDISCDRGDYFDKGLVSTGAIFLQNRSPKNPQKWTFAPGYPENIPKVEELELFLIKVCALVYEIFKNEMKRNNVVDFDDLINYPIEILRNNSELQTYYQNFFEHIIIDEFQDTSGAQLELVKLLLNESVPDITFVGDRKQSIYGFRYAQMENIDSLGDFIAQKYNKPITTIQLSTNYRSTFDVLNAVNFVTLNQLYLDEKLAPPEGKTSNPQDVGYTILTDIQDGYDHNMKEAEFIANEILSLKQERDLMFSDFAILVKSHAQADFFYKELGKKKIPCIKSVNTDFFTSSTVKNIIALLRLVKNIYDEQAFVRLLQIQLSDAKIYRLTKYANAKIKESELAEQIKSMNLCEKVIYLRENSLLQNSNLAPETVDYINDVFDIYDNIFRNHKRANLIFLFNKLINGIKPYKYSDTADIIKANQEIKIMEKIIAEFVNSKNYISIAELLKYFEKIAQDKNFKLPKNDFENEDVVKIMTIHASKGLEFEYLFVDSIKKKEQQDKSKLIFDLQYGNKPGFGLILKKYNDTTTPKAEVYTEIWKKPRTDSENVRLFYVALSRAKQYLKLLSFEKYSKTLPATYITDFTDNFST